MRYRISKTQNRGNQGWLCAQNENGCPVLLHQHLLVEKIQDENNMEKIKILEGRHKNLICYVGLNQYRQSYLSRNLNHNTASLTLSRAEICINNKTIKILHSPLKRKCEYFIGHPIFQSNIKMPEYYFIESKGGSKYVRTWFPIISTSGSFVTYLHLGRLSTGCLTIEIQDGIDVWTSIYRHIIYSRVDHKYLCSISS